MYVIDAADPKDPIAVARIGFEPRIRVGQVQALGNLLWVSEADGSRAIAVDISDPLQPATMPGGDFILGDRRGRRREAYASTISGYHVYFTRKDNGAGLLVYDISDPGRPTLVGEISSDGAGGYVAVKENLAYVGLSDRAAIYDVANPGAMREIMKMDIAGDLDTVTPLGRLAVLAVDEPGPDPSKASAIVPVQSGSDRVGPQVLWSWPAPDADGLAATSRFGVAMSETIDPRSAWRGSVILTEEQTGLPVAGVVSTQDTLVNFHPLCPLGPGVTYRLEVPAGGLADYSGNPVGRADRDLARPGERNRWKLSMGLRRWAALTGHRPGRGRGRLRPARGGDRRDRTHDPRGRRDVVAAARGCKLRGRGRWCTLSPLFRPVRIAAPTGG